MPFVALSLARQRHHALCVDRRKPANGLKKLRPSPAPNEGAALRKQLLSAPAAPRRNGWLKAIIAPQSFCCGNQASIEASARGLALSLSAF